MFMSLTIPIVETDHVRGPDDAALTLVEYGDFQCPHCRRAHGVLTSVFERLRMPVRFVFRHMPLSQIHRHAELAAEAAESAGAQGKFWEMHDALFDYQHLLSKAFIRALGERLALDMRQFDFDLQSERFRERVRADFIGGVRSGVAGTPTFFINGEKYDGDWEGGALLTVLTSPHSASPSGGSSVPGE